LFTFLYKISISFWREIILSPTTITSVKRNKTEHPLSWYQERMWLLNQKNPKDLSYNIPIAFLLEGELNYEALNRSLSEILHRHETLRTRFKTNSHGEAVQVISAPESFTLPVHHIQESEIPHFIEENMRYVFDLINKPIINGQLLRINSLRHLLLLNVHHIAADGWSIESIFFSELQKCYEAFSSGGIPELKPLPVQYIDFAYWHRQLDMSNGLAFWQKHLDGYEPSLELPSDFVRTPQSGSTSERFEYSYSADFSEALEKFAQTHGCTMFMCLLAGFALTINRYTGKDDICIGTTTSGRILPEIENLIGFFINILPLRISVDEENTVSDFLNTVRLTALSGFDHQTVPFERIVNSLSNHGNSSNSLVPLVIRHQNFPRTHLNNSLSGGVKFGSYPGYEGYRTATGKDAKARCEVELSYTGDRKKLEVEVMYASDLYKPSTIKNLLLHHEQLMREMINDDKQQLCNLTMLTPADRQRLLVEFNRTERKINNRDNFVLRWDEQVRKTPEKVACYDNLGKWHYKDIAAAANSFAIQLIQKGIKPGDTIGVCMERSASMLASVLAIWKTGAAYVPLDPSYPDSYLSLITNDAKPKLIVCTSVQQDKFAFDHDTCFIVNEKLPQLSPNSSVIPAIAISPDDPAYTMYTSGSTGKPKGVIIPHRQLINWLDNLETNWPFVEGEMVAQKTTIAFAVSVKEIFAGLLNGCPLTFIDSESVKDPVRFVSALQKCNASRLNLVPSHLQSILTYMKKAGVTLPSLRYCITAGEPLTAETVMAFRDIVPQARLLNNYGCTELNDITYYEATAFDDSQSFVPVGKPIQNTKLFILDRRGRPVPEGVPGEIHVASEGMALGYNNLDDLTKERFLHNPFSKDYREIMYNTGDVARYLADGNLEFIGRWDFQVKIRGFRVDVRHVEKIMGEYEGMGVRAVVGEKGQLLAFYTQLPAHVIDIGKLRHFLEQKLPPYMVPTAYIRLDEMPKLPNGKLNRRALKISSGNIQQSDAYLAPQTDTERVLAELWSEVLQIPEEHIGKHAHFFELGGHSLSATRLVARVKDRMGIEIGLSFIFEHPHLDEIADLLSSYSKPKDVEDEEYVHKFRKNNSGKSALHLSGILQGKVVLVTGASRGIGRSAVRLLASQGAKVAINYFNSDEHALMVKEIIEEDGGDAEIFQADTTDPDQIKTLVQQVISHFGKIDVLVSNAAIGFKITPFINSSWEDFERKITDELKSFYLLCKEVVPGMIERKSGSIIAVSSTMSKNPQPGYSAHSTAKAALDAFVRTMAIELGPDGIRINTVAPGLTITDATAAMSKRIKDYAAENCPLRRNGMPRDVSGAILFLASDLSQFITGSYLPVDGGYTML